MSDDTQETYKLSTELKKNQLAALDIYLEAVKTDESARKFCELIIKRLQDGLTKHDTNSSQL